MQAAQRRRATQPLPCQQCLLAVVVKMKRTQHEHSIAPLLEGMVAAHIALAYTMLEAAQGREALVLRQLYQAVALEGAQLLVAMVRQVLFAPLATVTEVAEAAAHSMLTEGLGAQDTEAVVAAAAAELPYTTQLVA